MEKKLPPLNPPWKILDAVIVLILINILGLLIKALGGDGLLYLAELLPEGRNQLNELFVSSLLQTFLFLSLIGYVILIKYKTSLKKLGFKKTKLSRWLVSGILNGILLFFAVVIIGALINLFLPIKIKPQPIAEIIMTAQTTWQKFIPFIVASFLAPLSEELYFRGFLYPALRKKIGVKFGILLTSLVFGGLHFDLVRMIPLALGGVWLNLLYERSGSILTSIIAHSVWNGIMTLCILFFQLQ